MTRGFLPSLVLMQFFILAGKPRNSPPTPRDLPRDAIARPIELVIRLLETSTEPVASLERHRRPIFSAGRDEGCGFDDFSQAHPLGALYTWLAAFPLPAVL